MHHRTNRSDLVRHVQSRFDEGGASFVTGPGAIVSASPPAEAEAFLSYRGAIPPSRVGPLARGGVYGMGNFHRVGQGMVAVLGSGAPS